MYLIDATPLQSEHRERGVGTYVRHLSAALLQHRPHDVQFVLAKNRLSEIPASVRERSHIAWRSHRPAQVYWIHNELFLRRAIHEKKPRVFHSTDFNGLVVVPDVAIVATLHDVMALKMPHPRIPSASDRLSHWRWTAYFRKLNQVTAIITVSDSVKQDAIQHLHLDGDRITTIYPGVDVARFSPDKPPAQRTRGQHYFLCVGAGDANKNYPRILHAFADVAQTHENLLLLITGRWNNESRQWLRNESVRLGISHRVEHLGYAEPSELESLYANALAFLFPSLEEGFGSPLVEAMASGTPFITTNYGALAEVAGPAGLLINPYDASALAQAMKDLVRFPRLRDALVQKGLRRAAVFSWKDVAARTVEVYQEAHRRFQFRA